ncbi:MAG TPA: SAM-dependent chlorinase/fluorinase [Gemmatimonadales bacterium]|nr:SAM-dependent chlorinase/fluorinase [Gemmatimonadales bacterium]
MAIITLLTDFGWRDSYVAEMKGVILAATPHAQLVDVSHDVPRGNIFAAQYLLARVWPRFPPHTVHLVVVDPTVGTQRRALAADQGGHRFVGPDNGILTPVLAGARTVELAVPADAAPTFHGRDVFGPAAARLAGGASLEQVGRDITNPVRTPLPVVRRDGRDAVGCVIYVDRFGTLVTNVTGVAQSEEGKEEPPGGGTAVVAGRLAPLKRTFADVDSGELVAFRGSGGTIEIAVRDGSAADVLGVREGAEVRLRP